MSRLVFLNLDASHFHGVDKIQIWGCRTRLPQADPRGCGGLRAVSSRWIFAGRVVWKVCSRGVSTLMAQTSQQLGTWGSVCDAADPAAEFSSSFALGA